MKVIRCDNFDRETVPDHLVKDGLTEAEAAQLAEELNAKGGPGSQDYYRAVPGDYQLKTWEP